MAHRLDRRAPDRTLGRREAGRWGRAVLLVRVVEGARPRGPLARTRPAVRQLVRLSVAVALAADAADLLERLMHVLAG